MRILVAGSGGREHAIIWKLAQSPNANKIYCAIGNAGINEIAEPVQISDSDADSLVNFAKEHNIDFTVVGPEVPLSCGIVDKFAAEDLKIFGPSEQAARLESSKVFAKEFMKRHKIPTAEFRKFSINNEREVLEYLESSKFPIVIKADGLAAGKGVVICDNFNSAGETIREFFENKIFGKAGESVVIEEFLSGEEASVFAVSDGTDYVLLPPAQDHKKIFDGEKGKNTGGMGSFAPATGIVTGEVLQKVKSRIIEPVLKFMKKEGNEFKGCLYCGLMIDEARDPYVIEFNVRFGDPESQVVLPLIESDFLELLEASSAGNIKNYKLQTAGRYYCSVVLASRGYPGKYETGKEISGLDKVKENCLVFHAGTARTPDGKIITSGGRVLNVVGQSDESLEGAIDAAYENVNIIGFENKYFRKDIGQKGLNKGA